MVAARKSSISFSMVVDRIACVFLSSALVVMGATTTHPNEEYNHHHKHNNNDNKNRMMTTTSSSSTTIIPTPTAPQLRYQSTDFSALVTFNMATFARNGDPGCDATNWNVQADYATGPTSDPATFYPARLNITQWFESITALGANIATLTAKHGCGFLLWPTNVTLPERHGGGPYRYNVNNKMMTMTMMASNKNTNTSSSTSSTSTTNPVFSRDVVQEFADAAKVAGVGYGYYYSIMKNYYLCRDFHGANSCMETILDGQYNLTDAEYLSVATNLAKELWTNYGSMTELWFDSDLLGLDGLVNELQPTAAGTPANPRYWCGTESGYPSERVGAGDIWNTGFSFQGDPMSSIWVDKFCDPQLFVQESLWFWEPNQPVRTLTDMIPIYHDIVGRGMIMELGIAPNREGLIDESHATLMKDLGDWVRSCYGSPVAVVLSHRGSSRRNEEEDIVVLTIPVGVVMDRIMLQEDLVWGQRIRNYTIEVHAAFPDVEVIVGGSVGRKRIHLLSQPYVSYDIPMTVKLHITGSIATPQLQLFGAFGPCPTTTTTTMEKTTTTDQSSSQQTTS
jgi:alpha-L-fucosidase